MAVVHTCKYGWMEPLGYCSRKKQSKVWFGEGEPPVILLVVFLISQSRRNWQTNPHYKFQADYCPVYAIHASNKNQKAHPRNIFQKDRLLCTLAGGLVTETPSQYARSLSVCWLVLHSFPLFQPMHRSQHCQRNAQSISWLRSE